MPVDKAAEQENISFNDSTAITADFEEKCTGVVLKTDADVYVAFDRPADTASLLLESTDLVVHFPVEFTTISALGSSGSGTLYVLGLR